MIRFPSKQWHLIPLPSPSADQLGYIDGLPIGATLQCCSIMSIGILIRRLPVPSKALAGSSSLRNFAF